MSRWSRYWFGEGGQLGAAVIRIAIATSVLWTLAGLHVDGGPPSAYDPDGLMMLLGASMPPPWLIDALLAVAFASTAAMLLGLLSRASTAISLFSALALASYEVSFTPGWSHHNNAVFLAHLAFLFAWGGDALSVDTWIRRWLGRPAPSLHRYQFSIRLVQFAVALTFFNAAMIKLAQAHFTLDWALSDNLRNHLLVHYDLSGNPRTTVANWLMQSPWRYQTAALLNLISQSLPFVALLVQRRPWLRFACGAFFAIETLAFGLVMNLWNLHWLPLTAAFVDWDRLFGRAASRSIRAEPMPCRQRRLLAVFVTAFVVYDLAVAFAYPRIDTVLKTYPFSAFPMFSRIRAERPYQFLGGRIAADAPAEVLARINRQRAYRFLHRTRDRDRLRARLDVASRQISRYAGQNIGRIGLHLVVFRATSPPEPAALDEQPIALIAETSADGEFRSFVGATGRDRQGRYLQPGESSALPAGTRVLYFPDDGPTALELDGEWRGSRFYYGDVRGRTQAFAIETGGARWFVAREPHRGWW